MKFTSSLIAAAALSAVALPTTASAIGISVHPSSFDLQFGGPLGTQTDSTFENYANGAVFEMPNLSVTVDQQNIHIGSHFRFVLTETISYAISGMFSGTAGIADSVNAQINVYLEKSPNGLFNDIALANPNFLDVKSTAVAPGQNFSLALDNSPSLGFLTGTIGPGSYEMRAYTQLWAGVGSGTGSIKLQLGEAKPTTPTSGVPDTGSTLALAGFALIALVSMNRMRSKQL